MRLFRRKKYWWEQDEEQQNLFQPVNDNVDVANKRNCSTIDDVYYSADGRINTKDHEGGYNFARQNDAGGATNYGITQSSLDEYNNWNSPYRHGFNFPTKVKDLSNDQAKQILDEKYFKRHAIDKLCNTDLA